MTSKLFALLSLVAAIVGPFAFVAAAEDDLDSNLSRDGADVLLVGGNDLDRENLGWLNWAFDVDRKRRADWSAIKNWLSDRKRVQANSMRQRLHRIGEAGFDLSKLPDACFDDLLCAQLEVITEAVAHCQNRQRLTAALSQAQPYYRAYSTAIEIALQVSPLWIADDSTMLDRLRTRLFPDQVLWRLEEAKEPISPDAKRILRSLILSSAWRTSVDNVAFLRAEILKDGWPPMSKIGKTEAWKAWLIVQHADHAPDFQLDVLQQMRPLLERREVLRQNYAYLYDRIRLNIGQPQLYGTQFHCVDGKLVPKPLEHPEGVDERRAEMDMSPLAELAKTGAFSDC